MILGPQSPTPQGAVCQLSRGPSRLLLSCPSPSWSLIFLNSQDQILGFLGAEDAVLLPLPGRGRGSMQGQ